MNAETVSPEPTKIEQTILETLRQLPLEKQREALDFIEFLRQRLTTASPRHSLEGLWSAEGIQITDLDIQEAREEMWGDFSREETP